MEKLPSESEPAPLWERLRDRLEQLRVTLDRKQDSGARARKLSERARLMRHRAGAVEPTSVPMEFLAITKARERYGIPLEFVLEVQALDQYSPVPGAPEYIRGVVHWRGAILALLEMTRLFEVAETGLSDLHAYVVVEAAGQRLAIAVSSVDDIFCVPRHQLKGAPDLPGRIASEWVLGIHDENRLILRLDAVVQHLQQARAG